VFLHTLIGEIVVLSVLEEVLLTVVCQTTVAGQRNNPYDFSQR